ncbi:hypothetical protein ACRAQ6_13975 [Erythrobacter sp. HA6-11]
MSEVKCKLLKPLDGDEIGATRTFRKADADRLVKQKAVKIIRSAKAAAKPKNKAAPKPDNKSAS